MTRLKMHITKMCETGTFSLNIPSRIQRGRRLRSASTSDLDRILPIFEQYLKSRNVILPEYDIRLVGPDDIQWHVDGLTIAQEERRTALIYAYRRADSLEEKRTLEEEYSNIKRPQVSLLIFLNLGKYY